ncbi:NADH-quinone oxidoreductase subunit NuoE [Rhodococcus rhodnii]|uniref:NADH dehydrogenase subunit E n=2 Tax=Rhodococcus rhodnii TaxID=38312 RepID=R7WP15_9NOCA|nr:NADH-quinone oxidoreductase subunit NuoE [Rhodococcus rhodnii]EOM75724.1 NADH dehydrogenase subunit E [Rhodococcus rhodnii LMG 5362]TXG89639.1 NADH-quinone oxidoreductase subunit NuoE [Rhodococcus rhodnii]
MTGDPTTVEQAGTFESRQLGKGAATDPVAPAPVLLQIGPRPDEATQLVQPGARTTYPAATLDELHSDAAQIVALYPSPRSALLPLLHLVQSVDGYITPAGIDFCADTLALTGAEVAAVATFYSMYRRSPTGEYVVGVCANTLCAVLGGDEILASLREHLGIEPGGTTDDEQITLERLECNAACDYAPVVMVNWEYYDNSTPTSARELVDRLRNGDVPQPTRGGPVCGFRDTERALAGLPERTPRSPVGPSAGTASLAGLHVARERGMHAPDRSEPGRSEGGPS